MLFIFRPGKQYKAPRGTQDGAEVVSSGNCSGLTKSISSGYQGLLQEGNKELEMQFLWRIVLKNKRADACAAQRHSGPGIREELLKSRQELSSLLRHSWVTPVKCQFANLQPGESTAVFTVKNLQESYRWRTQHSNKWQIKLCRAHRGSSFSFALIFRDESIPHQRRGATWSNIQQHVAQPEGHSSY